MNHSLSLSPFLYYKLFDLTCVFAWFRLVVIISKNSFFIVCCYAHLIIWSDLIFSNCWASSDLESNPRIFIWICWAWLTSLPRFDVVIRSNCRLNHFARIFLSWNFGYSLLLYFGLAIVFFDFCLYATT